jgi:hypothetical protein
VQARCAVLGLLAAHLRGDAGARRAATQRPELLSALLALIWDARTRAPALSLVRSKGPTLPYHTPPYHALYYLP